LHRGVLLGQLGVEVHSIAQRRGAYLAQANADIAATIVKARIAAIFDIACITAIFASAPATTVATAASTTHFDAGRYSAC
jgi:hypothetical protein